MVVSPMLYLHNFSIFFTFFPRFRLHRRATYRPLSFMSLSKQRKLYVAVLGLALGGLAVDRLLLDGGSAPRRAAAQLSRDEPTESADAPASPIASAPAGAQVVRSSTLSSRLDELARARQLDPAQASDAFAASPAWVSTVAVKPVEKSAPPAEDVFRKSHKLMAVVLNGGNGAAIIDDKTYVVGMEVGGYTLRSLTKRSAMFEAQDGRRVELELAAPLEKPGR